MSLLDFIIPTAYAAGAASAPSEGNFAPIFLLFVIVALMYVLIWRPQNKLKKEHANLVTGLAVGDEIVTNSGIVGKVVALDGLFITLQIAKDVDITLQKAAVTSALPKGTVKM